MIVRTDAQVLERVTAWLDDSLQWVSDDGLESATPCADWTVRDLLDHVAGGNRFTVEILGGASADEALQSARASFDEGRGSTELVATSLVDQLDAFVVEGVLDLSCDHVAGTLLGSQVLRLRVHDMAIHTWDLLQAVNPKKGLDPVYVRWAIDELAREDSLTAAHIAKRVAAPKSSYELLMAFGRQRNTVR